MTFVTSEFGSRDNNVAASDMETDRDTGGYGGGDSGEIYFFHGNFDFVPVQGGQFVLHRQRSGACLRRWRQLMDESTHVTKDQVFLKQMLEEHQLREQQLMRTKDGSNGDPRFPDDNPIGVNHRCQMHLMDQRPHLFFPSMLQMIELIEGYKDHKRRQNIGNSQRNTNLSFRLEAGNATVGTTNDGASSSVAVDEIEPPLPSPSLFPTVIHVKNTGDATTIPGPIQEQFFNIVLRLTEKEQATTRLGKRTIINSDPYWRTKVQEQQNSNLN